MHSGTLVVSGNLKAISLKRRLIAEHSSWPLRLCHTGARAPQAQLRSVSANRKDPTFILAAALVGLIRRRSIFWTVQRAAGRFKRVVPSLEDKPKIKLTPPDCPDGDANGVSTCVESSLASALLLLARGGGEESRRGDARPLRLVL